MTRLRHLAAALGCSWVFAMAAHANGLDDALAATYSNNPTIKAQRARQQANDEEVAQAVSGFRPTANGLYSRGRQRTSLSGSPWNYGDAETRSLRINQPLFRGGGTFSGYNAAKQRVRAGQNQLEATQQQVLVDAVTVYMDTVSATSTLQLARENENSLAQQLTASQERFQVGEVTRTDVAQSESRLSIARAQVVAAEGRLISAIARFERVIGYRPEGLLEKPDLLPEVPVSLNEALQMAHGANPELIAAVHTAKSSNYDVWTNKSALLPRVDLVGSMSRQDGAGAFGTDSFDQDSVAVEVNVPLYQSGAEYSRVREAKSIARERQYAVVDTRMEIDRQVTSAWEQMETASATITQREAQIGAAEMALEGVRQEREYGARTVLDVLDAEQELYNARTGLVQAERDRVVAVYNMLRMLGRMTPDYLQLAVVQYDPEEHYDEIKFLPIGF
jgi:outer membrane protein